MRRRLPALLAVSLTLLNLAADTAPIPQSPPVAAPAPAGQPLPINLPTALRLANARPVDISVAADRIRVAEEQLDRARLLWLPAVYVGSSYSSPDVKIETVEGKLIDKDRQALTAGAAPVAVFGLTDAIFEPLAAQQVLKARQAEAQATANNVLLSVAESYFNVQQARGDLAGAEDTVRRAGELVRRMEGAASPGASQALTELEHRKQFRDAARQRWRAASAELSQMLRLDANALVAPIEPPNLRVTLLTLDGSVDDVIPVALRNRPELEAQQALVEATLERLQEEKMRPLVPSLLLRGNAANPSGSPTGLNGNLGNFGGKNDFDVQVLWELKSLGFGNRARIDQRKAEYRRAMLQSLSVQDRVAAEVNQAFTEAKAAAERVTVTETTLKSALGRADDILLVAGPVSPEAVAGVRALARAYQDYYAAVGDFNRGQFRLYRALGQPAHLVNCSGTTPQDKKKAPPLSMGRPR